MDWDDIKAYVRNGESEEEVPSSCTRTELPCPFPHRFKEGHSEQSVSFPASQVSVERLQPQPSIMAQLHASLAFAHLAAVAVLIAISKSTTTKVILLMFCTS